MFALARFMELQKVSFQTPMLSVCFRGRRRVYSRVVEGPEWSQSQLLRKCRLPKELRLSIYYEFINSNSHRSRPQSHCDTTLTKSGPVTHYTNTVSLCRFWCRTVITTGNGARKKEATLLHGATRIRDRGCNIVVFEFTLLSLRFLYILSNSPVRPTAAR